MQGVQYVMMPLGSFGMPYYASTGYNVSNQTQYYLQPQGGIPAYDSSYRGYTVSSAVTEISNNIPNRRSTNRREEELSAAVQSLSVAAGDENTSSGESDE